MRRGLVASSPCSPRSSRRSPRSRELGAARDQGRRRERPHGPERQQLPRQAEHHRAELGHGARSCHGESQVVVDPDAECRIAELDAAIVRRSASPAAKTFREGQGRGLEPPRRLGNEVVARLIWLRFNHPQRTTALELRPQDSGTRAEAAYSLARALQISQWDKDNVESLADSFSLPPTATGRSACFSGPCTSSATLRVGRHVGAPAGHFGVTSRGGFDCSGFVWRVYKLQPFPNGGSLSSVLQGRTDYR
jgi:hypothetical protein